MVNSGKVKLDPFYLSNISPAQVALAKVDLEQIDFEHVDFE